MNQPITKTEKEISERIVKTNVETDITKRWENGTPHHPEAERLARETAAIDWLFGGDNFCFKFGGDGDNGETLAYLLDVLFDLKDAEAQ
jgi:hypothetical protein